MGSVLTSVERELLEQSMHDEMVREIAASRFGIDGWNVDISPGVSDSTVPDIIARSNDEIALGEVETSSTITDAEAMEWKCFGEWCERFYLFIPDGLEKEALSLIERYEISCAGLRCYSWNGVEVSFRSVPVEQSFSKDKSAWWINLGRE
jgi:hypothetical protein